MMNHSLALVSPRHGSYLPQPTQLMQRLILYYQDELYRVPSCYHHLRIAAGQAYVTQAGQDHILQAGQEIQLDSAADPALVSGIGEGLAILELSV